MDTKKIGGINLYSIVEAILFSCDKPLSPEDIARAIQSAAENVTLKNEDIEEAVNELNARYEDGGRCFGISYTGGGYAFTTKAAYHPWLRMFQHQNARRKISQSALETLAIIAYKQPVTKPEVNNLRGVDSGYIVRQLMEKNLIEVAGRFDGPGRALLYRTSSVFLAHFGINSISDLPKPREIEEILKDDDMAEHRQLMIDLKTEIGTNASVAADPESHSE
ncbi:MAG: SMC-Scp complex subunit ScpB [Balneolales bacterium]